MLCVSIVQAGWMQAVAFMVGVRQSGRAVVCLASNSRAHAFVKQAPLRCKTNAPLFLRASLCLVSTHATHQA